MAGGFVAGRIRNPYDSWKRQQRTVFRIGHAYPGRGIRRSMFGGRGRTAYNGALGASPAECDGSGKDDTYEQAVPWLAVGGDCLACAYRAGGPWRNG
jgi:hypothetical protein